MLSYKGKEYTANTEHFFLFFFFQSQRNELLGIGHLAAAAKQPLQPESQLCAVPREESSHQKLDGGAEGLQGAWVLTGCSSKGWQEAQEDNAEKLRGNSGQPQAYTQVSLAMKEVDEKLDYFKQPNDHEPGNVNCLCQGLDTLPNEAEREMGCGYGGQ